MTLIADDADQLRAMALQGAHSLARQLGQPYRRQPLNTQTGQQRRTLAASTHPLHTLAGMPMIRGSLLAA
jgi:hypothetical protein